MASAVQKTSQTPAKRGRKTTTQRGVRRAANGRARAGSRSARTTIGDLENIIRGLEERIASLTSGGEIRSVVSGAADQVTRMVSNASHQVGDMVSDRLTDVAGKVRNSATSVTDAARAGTGAVQRIGAEMERRPLMTLAIALGIGFLAGMAGRRTDQS